jgi:hypothetical protein
MEGHIATTQATKREPLGTVRPIYRTGTPLPSKNPILYIFSTNTCTEFFTNFLAN